MGEEEKGAPSTRPSDPTVARRGPRVNAITGGRDGGASASGTDGGAATPATGATLDATISVDPDQAIRAVLLGEEATRARGFAFATVSLSSLVAVALPFLGGDPLAARICAASLAIMLGVSVWVLYRTGPDTEFTRGVVRVQAWTLTTAILGAEYYVGFYSPITVVLSLGIYYVGQAQDRATSISASLWVSSGWAAGCLLIATGVMQDKSLFPATNLELQTQLFITAAVVASLVMTLVMAQIARASVRRAIKDSNDAVLVARKQAAQLAEAKNQLDRAMKLAVGKAGQYTGQLAGDCELGVLIGLGAMGEVYEATDRTTQQDVAVKLLHDATRQSPDLLERFLREAEICKELDHPHLVGVHSAGTLADGEPYLVMERLVGDDLGAMLRSRRSMTLGETRALCDQVAAGLQHTHDHGVIHRDLKPHNIFRTSDERGRPHWKVLDFGISRHMDSSGTLTQGGVVGTPAYMSPEQARGKRLDGRSDVFSLSAVIYRALTGRPAFPGEDTPRIMFDVAYRQPDKPSLQAEGIPSDVDLVIAVGLAKDPDERFESAPALARALAAAIKRRLPEDVRTRAVALLARQPWGFAPEAPGRASSQPDRPA